MKGSISLDAIVALVIALMVFAWIQGYARSVLDNTNTFGVNLYAKSSAIDVGSRMNAFYAWVPGANDFVIVSGQAMLFGANSSIMPEKQSPGTSASAAIIYKYVIYNTTYPVPAGIRWDATASKIRR